MENLRCKAWFLSSKYKGEMMLPSAIFFNWNEDKEPNIININENSKEFEVMDFVDSKHFNLLYSIGKKDCTQENIFQGDFVKFPGNNKLKGKYLVIWDQEKSMWSLQKDDNIIDIETLKSIDIQIPWEECEIVGNRFEKK